MVLGGGFAGLLLFLHLEKTSSAPETNPLGFAIFMAVLGAVGGGYLTSIAICAFKGKASFAFLGGFIGAIRLGKPTSPWARRYYGQDKLRVAVLRFPECYTSLRNDSAFAIEISRDAPGCCGYLIQPGRTVTFLADLSVIGSVIRTTGRDFRYTAFTFHPPQRTLFQRRKKYSYVFTAERFIYPLGPDGLVIREAQGFPVKPRSS